MTSVWPALWPPWKRTTTSACSESQSTILPLPSSPHCEPTTTTFAIASSSLPFHAEHRPNGVRSVHFRIQSQPTGRKLALKFKRLGLLDLRQVADFGEYVIRQF